MKLPRLHAIEAELARRRITTNGMEGHLGAGKVFEEDLPALVQAAGRLDPKFRRVFLEAAAALRDSVDIEALADALRAGRLTTVDLDRALAKAPEELRHGWGPILLAGFGLGTEHAVGQVPGGATMRLDLLNATAVDWAHRHAALRVTQVDAETRVAIRDLAAEAVAGQRDVRATARMIQAVVGLTDRQVGALDARRAAWEADGLAGERLWARVGRLADAYLRQRGELIARTEILTAANQGQSALWRQAVHQGLLDRTEWVREWLATEDDRLDPICEELDGQTAPVDGGAFPGGYDGPPAHPACRCATRLARASEAE